jgi:trigger factor
VNVTIENVASCRKKLNIEIPATEVVQEWKGVLKEFQKFAQIPGFRVGKAPIPILEKKFVKEIGSEVQRKLIPTSYREAVAKEKLKVVSQPEIEEINFSPNEPLKYQATVDVSPEFALPNYKGLKAKKPKAEVKDEDIDNALKLLAEQQANFADVTDRGLALGDFAVISYSGTCEGKPISEFHASAKPLSENKQFWLLMAKDSFVPGFCEPLVGSKVNEKKEVKIEFPSDFRIKELAGKKAEYAVEVLGIREKQLPALDDAFAVSYKAANIKELKDRVRENMSKDREQHADASVKNSLMEQLLKETTFEVPESVVNDETRTTMMNIVRENQARGLSDEMIREKSKEILDVAQHSAKDKVRATFILAKIADEEKLKVKDEDVQQQIEQTAQRMGRPVADLRKHLQESGEIEALREQILIGQALDLVVSHAIVETE